MIEKLKNLLHINKKVPIISVEERIDEMYDSLATDELRICIGEDLVEFAGGVCDAIWDLRERVKDKNGFIMPPVRILDMEDIQENEYQIYVRDVLVFTGYTVPKSDYATDEIVKSLEDVCIEHIDEIFTNEITEKYMDFVQRKNGMLMWNISRVMAVTGIRYILIDLLKSGKSIKNIALVFETIGKYVLKDNDICCFSPKNTQKIARNVKEDIM